MGMMFYFQRLLMLTSSWTIRAQKQYSALRWINFPRGPGWSHQLSKCTNLKRQFFNLIEKLFAEIGFIDRIFCNQPCMYPYYFDTIQLLKWFYLTWGIFDSNWWKDYVNFDPLCHSKGLSVLCSEKNSKRIFTGNRHVWNARLMFVSIWFEHVLLCMWQIYY